MYASGRGVEQNVQFSMMWLASAAAQGDNEARKYLNEIIDSERERLKTAKTSPTKHSSSTAVRFLILEKGMICTKPQSEHCVAVDKNQRTFTSNHKENGWYKITGMATPKGWMPYDKEGWVREASVEIQR
jgi:TPR repeat protein